MDGTFSWQCFGQVIIETVICIIFCFIFHKGDAFRIYEWFYWNSGHKTIPNILSPKISASLRKSLIGFYILILLICQGGKKKKKQTKFSSKKMLYFNLENKIISEDKRSVYPDINQIFGGKEEPA